MTGEMLNRIREVEALAKEKENTALARATKLIERAKEESNSYLCGIMQEEEELKKKALMEATQYRNQQLEQALVEALEEVESFLENSKKNKKKAIDTIIKEVLHNVSA